MIEVTEVARAELRKILSDRPDHAVRLFIQGYG